MSGTTKRQRAKKQAFTSKADTIELRNYQRLASQYPPLTHNEIILHSRRFVKGRNAEVEIEERDLVDKILNGDWSEENIRNSKETILSAYNAKIDWLNLIYTSNDILYMLLPEDGSEDPSYGFYRHRFDNVFARFPWEKEMSLMSCYLTNQLRESISIKKDNVKEAAQALKSEISSMTFEEFSMLRASILSLAAIEIRERLPKMAAPKDVVDRWKEKLDLLSNRYMSTVQALNKTERETRRLILTIATGQDSLDTIINHNMQLAMSRVSKMMKANPRAKQIGAADLIATANLGLVLGARQFDPEMGRKFSTYVSYHIDGQLYDILSREDGKCGIKGMSAHEQKQLSTIITVKTTFEKLFNREPTMAELRSITHINTDIIEKRLATPQIHTQNIYAPASRGKNEEDSPMLADVLDSGVTVESEIAKDNYTELVDMVKDVIGTLSPEERKILEIMDGVSVNGLDDGLQTTATARRQLARELGISTKELQARHEAIHRKLKKDFIYYFGDKTGNSLDVTSVVSRDFLGNADQQETIDKIALATRQKLQSVVDDIRGILDIEHDN